MRLDETGASVHDVNYSGVSVFIGIAYIAALLFTVATWGLNILSCCAPRAIVAGLVTSLVATISTLAASIAALVVFANIKGKFNKELVQTGIKTALGNKPFIVSWIAFGLLFTNSILLCLHYRQGKQTRARNRGAAKSVGINSKGMDKNDGEEAGFAPPKRTKTLQLVRDAAMNITSPWSKQKYAKIGEPTVVKNVGGNEDRANLVNRGFGGGEDEDDDRDELVRGQTRGIALQPFGNSGPTREKNTAYEPFRHTPGAI